MPKKLEAKLKKEYGANSDIPYKIMNKMGVMHGNKETKKGRSIDERFEHNPFAKRYKAKNDARHEALKRKAK